MALLPQVQRLIEATDQPCQPCIPAVLLRCRGSLEEEAHLRMHEVEQAVHDAEAEEAASGCDDSTGARGSGFVGLYPTLRQPWAAVQRWQQGQRQVV